MTMMQKGDKSAKKFDELVSEKDPGLTDDERMQLAAKQMQSRFKQEELKTSVLLPIPVRMSHMDAHIHAWMHTDTSPLWHY